MRASINTLCACSSRMASTTGVLTGVLFVLVTIYLFLFFGVSESKRCFLTRSLTYGFLMAADSSRFRSTVRELWPLLLMSGVCHFAQHLRCHSNTPIVTNMFPNHNNLLQVDKRKLFSASSSWTPFSPFPYYLLMAQMSCQLDTILVDASTSR